VEVLNACEVIGAARDWENHAMASPRVGIGVDVGLKGGIALVETVL
jgi:hypothetical protein